MTDTIIPENDIQKDEPITTQESENAITPETDSTEEMPVTPEAQTNSTVESSENK
jgi:hypothetical protein